MASIVISSNTYFSYASVADADAFLLVQPNTTAWFGLSDDDKGKSLVTSSTWLDSLIWKEECSPQSVREGKASIVNAAILLANQLANGDSSFLGLEKQEQPVKRIKAGSVEQEYHPSFWMYYDYNKNDRFYNVPSYVMALIKNCLSGNGTNVAGSLSYGTDTTSTAGWPWGKTLW